MNVSCSVLLVFNIQLIGKRLNLLCACNVGNVYHRFPIKKTHDGGEECPTVYWVALLLALRQASDHGTGVGTLTDLRIAEGDIGGTREADI